ncbi:citrate lyase acyl carrier protein [Pseudodesulfovibrio methanolicus]|uniref:Citrate lyase acyl carrier protein n=1 Tax=Pseudodesulfovibrio methanolicus TaxID=3126690 RepID=A0ABZ2IV69_9BACT
MNTKRGHQAEGETIMGQTASSQAGTLESNDIFIRMTQVPEGGESSVNVESIVMKQFGEDIIKTITQCLEDSGLKGVNIRANDRGALRCTILARMEAAITRYKESIK